MAFKQSIHDFFRSILSSRTTRSGQWQRESCYNRYGVRVGQGSSGTAQTYYTGDCSSNVCSGCSTTSVIMSRVVQPKINACVAVSHTDLAMTTSNVDYSTPICGVACNSACTAMHPPHARQPFARTARTSTSSSSAARDRKESNRRNQPGRQNSRGDQIS